MLEKNKILFVDDEVNVLRSLRRLFLDESLELFTASSGQEGLEILEEEPDIMVVISDYRMPGMDGVDFLRKVYEKWPATIRMVLSGYADTASVVAAINEGKIYKFIPKPWNDDELKLTVLKAVEIYFLQKKNAELSEKLKINNEELGFLNRKLERVIEERNREILFKDMVTARGQFILDCLPVGVLGVNLDGIIVESNNKIIEILGGERPILGASFETLNVSGLTDLAAKAELGNITREKVKIGADTFWVDTVKAMDETRFEGVIFAFEKTESQAMMETD